MKIARLWIVRLSGLLFAALGVWLIVAPQWVEIFYGIKMTTPMAVSEMRAVFGGMMLGVGLVVLWLDLLRHDLDAASGVLVFVTAGLLVARAVGIVLDGFPTGPVRNETFFEVFLFLVLIITARLDAPKP